METLRKQVARVRRRLALQAFLLALPRWACVALVLLVLLVAADRYWAWNLSPAACWGGALLLTLLGAGLQTLRRYPSLLVAAIEIDRYFELQERVSSALAMRGDQLDTPAGELLLADAQRRLGQLMATDAVSLSLGRRAWAPLVPAALALVMMLFVAPRSAAVAQAETEQASALAKKQIDEARETLRRRLTEQRAEAKAKNLEEAEELFDKLERATGELARAEAKDPKQALVELNDLGNELNKRREQLGAESLRQQFKQLGSLGQGPGEQMANALQKGDFDRAGKELDKLRDQLANAKLDDAEKQKLAAQMDALKNTLDAMDKARQAQQDQLEQQIAQQRAAGNADAARALEDQLGGFMKQQNAQQQQLKDMAQQAAAAAQQLAQGNDAAAQQAMQDLANSLDGLDKQLAESQMLRDAMQQVAQAKRDMACACNGGEGGEPGGEGGNQQGLAAQQGKKPGQGAGAMPQGGGNGIGNQPGSKPFDPNAENYDGAIDSRVAGDLGQGSAQITDLVGGPNRKGIVQQQIREQTEAMRVEATDPLTGQSLTRAQRDHAREYFDKLREGAAP